MEKAGVSLRKCDERLGKYIGGYLTISLGSALWIMDLFLTLRFKKFF